MEVSITPNLLYYFHFYVRVITDVSVSSTISHQQVRSSLSVNNLWIVLRMDNLTDGD